MERTLHTVLIAGHANKFGVTKPHDVSYPDEEAHGDTTADIVAKFGPLHDQDVITQPGVSLLGISTCAPEDSYMKPVGWKVLPKNAVDQTLGRTIMLSSKRYLGLSPEVAGDQIFVLLGLYQLVILRPQESGSFKFVGTAYVHGLMRGEWQEKFNLSLYEPRMLTI